MNTSIINWGFHIEVLARSLKDLESVTLADPKSAEFAFLRSEAQDILKEANDALSALESYLRSLPTASSTEPGDPTQH